MNCASRKRKYFALLVIADLSTEDENGDIPSRRNRVNWVRPWMARREERGVFHQLAMELAVEDASGYTDFFRFNSQQFEFLFNAVSHRISKQDTKNLRHSGAKIELTAANAVLLNLELRLKMKRRKDRATTHRNSDVLLTYHVVDSNRELKHVRF